MWLHKSKLRLMKNQTFWQENASVCMKTTCFSEYFTTLSSHFLKISHFSSLKRHDNTHTLSSHRKWRHALNTLPKTTI